MNGALKAEFKRHTDKVRSVAFSPDGTQLATGSDDNTARVYDILLDPGVTTTLKKKK